MVTLPTQHSFDDLFWMARAIDLAREMRGHVWPNPPVGCVIIRDGVDIAQAATHVGGRPHAERIALDLAGANARDAVLYVTLEPCCHWGETPPCVDAIIDAGVARVVCATRDPDPRVNGAGFEKLTRAGIVVAVGARADEAKRVMSGFFNRIRYGVPELVATNKEQVAPPPGIDALIRSSQRGPRLITRRGEFDVCGTAPHRLLTHMGDLGLTSVAVSGDDPLWRVLSTLSAKQCVENHHSKEI